MFGFILKKITAVFSFLLKSKFRSTDIRRKSDILPTVEGGGINNDMRAIWAGKLEIPPADIRRISSGGMRISSVFLTNERRAEGIKDLTKQQGLPSKYF